MNEQPWRQHFSNNAGDLIAIHEWICGPEIAKRIMLACFKRSPRSQRINETTVCNVLQDLNIYVAEDGTCFVPEKRAR